MPKEKLGQCDSTVPHPSHDVWVSNPRWPVSESAEPTLLHCYGIESVEEPKVYTITNLPEQPNVS